MSKQVTSVDLDSIVNAIISAEKADKKVVERMATENREAIYQEKLSRLDDMRSNDE